MKMAESEWCAVCTILDRGKI